MTEVDYISNDTETGGLRPAIHALLSIAAVASWNGRKEKFLVFLWPAEGKIVDPQAAEKNGYSVERWTELGAVDLVTGMQWYREWLDKRFAERPRARMLAHHYAFDKAFLDEAAAQSGVPMPIRHAWRDSMTTFGDAMDDGLVAEGSCGLERLGELCGFWPTGKRPAIHEPDEDALCTLVGMEWLRVQRSAEIEF